jgi:hypothetical protein
VRKLIVIVLAAVLLVGASVGATWYVVGRGDDTGWSEQEEKDTYHWLRSGTRSDNSYTKVEAACALEVYEQYFPSYDDFDNASDDSPTFLKANAAAGRRCFSRR